MLLNAARAKIGRGEFDSARTTLLDVERRFPKSQLIDEREALGVHLASASGDRETAYSLARAFIEKHPESSLRPGIEALARKNENR